MGRKESNQIKTLILANTSFSVREAKALARLRERRLAWAFAAFTKITWTGSNIYRCLLIFFFSFKPIVFLKFDVIKKLLNIP